MKKNDFRRITALLIVLVMALMLFTACGGTAEQGDTEDAGSSEEAADLVKAEISIRDYGTVELELDPNEAPITVQNFVDLAQSGFYDGLKFHRIMDGFMIQGGGNEAVDLEPIPGEFSANGVENNISHQEGVISMARTQDPDSATSQFFITVADDTFLDGQYAAFGYVTEGLDICKKIAQDADPIDDNGTIPEEEQPVIEYIKIID